MMRRERLRPNLALILLLASVGVLGVAAFQAQDAVRTSKRQAEETLRDYTTFAAWSFRQHLRNELFRAAAAVLQPINHGNSLHEGSVIPPAIALAHMLPFDSAGCFCHRAAYAPTHFFAFTLGADTLAIVPNVHHAPGQGVVVDTAVALRQSETGRLPPIREYTVAERRWMSDTLAASVRREFQIEWDYGMVLTQRGGEAQFLAYRPMATVWGDTIVYGFALDATVLDRLFGGIIDHADLLPAGLTRDRANRELMRVEIRDRSGRVLYRSDETPPPVWMQREDRLPTAYAGLTVRAAIKPEMAESMIIGGLPRSRLPLLLGLLVLASALAVVAVQQLRREAALTRMRGDFVAAVSHELRTPLTQIRLYLDTMRMGRMASEKERERSFEHLDREATRLSNLVENVLRFSSIGSGRAIRIEPTDVAAEVRATAEAFEPLARSRRSRLALDLAANLRVPLGRDAFRVALLNLLDNAVKYGPAGQTITIRTRLDAGDCVMTVDDEGKGVAPEARRLIWEPFRRGADEAARAVGGSGIGLSIVRDVMEHHGGHAHVEEAPGGGARFVLRFPGAVLDPADSEPAAVPARNV
jgi:signal transduction histidine kinase